MLPAEYIAGVDWVWASNPKAVAAALICPSTPVIANARSACNAETAVVGCDQGGWTTRPSGRGGGGYCWVDVSGWVGIWLLHTGVVEWHQIAVRLLLCSSRTPILISAYTPLVTERYHARWFASSRGRGRHAGQGGLRWPRPTGLHPLLSRLSQQGLAGFHFRGGGVNTALRPDPPPLQQKGSIDGNSQNRPGDVRGSNGGGVCVQGHNAPGYTCM